MRVLDLNENKIEINYMESVSKPYISLISDISSNKISHSESQKPLSENKEDTDWEDSSKDSDEHSETDLEPPCLLNYESASSESMFSEPSSPPPFKSFPKLSQDPDSSLFKSKAMADLIVNLWWYVIVSLCVFIWFCEVWASCHKSADYTRTLIRQLFS